MSSNIVVIGSGFGGISCALRLISAGHNVTLLEKRDQPGGRAYVYREQGYTFDAGPTVITAPHCLEELFEINGARMEDYVELLDVEPFYKLFWEDGTVFDYTNNPSVLEEQIKNISPNDWKGYGEFLKYSKEVFHEGYTKLAHEPFLNWWSMIKVAPQLMKLRAERSVYKTVAKFIEDEHLRQAFSFHSLLVGGNPFSTSSIYTLIHYLERKWGVTFPKGGTGALVQGLIKRFEELGGKLILNAEVDQILTSGNQVRGVHLKSGEHLEADAVVSNGDVMHTYKELLGQHPQGQRVARKLKRSKWSMSLFLIYFGAKKKFDGIAHHNVLFGPRYKGLLDDIFKNKTLADDFSLYMHAPTLTDPSLAPEGHECFYVLSPVPHMDHLDIDWDVEGPKYADRILRYMDERYLPGLMENLTVKKIFTPKDFKTELNAHAGSAFSLEPVLTQSAFFRTHNRDDAIKGLYFVGAGTHPGAGVPGVVNSAKATAGLVIDDLGVGDIRESSLHPSDWPMQPPMNTGASHPTELQ